jgi:integrase
LKSRIAEDIARLECIISRLEHTGESYTAGDVVARYLTPSDAGGFFSFARSLVGQLRQIGKIRTSERYTTVLNSFGRFRRDVEVPWDEVDSDLMIAYEAWLKSGGVSMNTISFYMRNLRAVYNRAVEKELVIQRFPFRHVYTGVERTTKRAVPLRAIKQLMTLDLSLHPAKRFARDMLLLSFYTRGMSMIDMVFLKKKDLNNGILSYRRKKTGQQLFVKWEPCMQEIVDRYNIPGSPYLLPIIARPGMDERKQYINASHRINRYLKAIGKELGLSVPLTHYVARHSWASAARSKNIPISVISEGMGHDSENTTRIYLTTLDTATIDKANRLILNSLCRE